MLNILNHDQLKNLISFRAGETKSGELIRAFTRQDNWEEELRTLSNVRFVVAGIPEDIGPRANFGNAGSSAMWEALLKKLVNLQSNYFFDWSTVLIAGEIFVDDLMNSSKGLDAKNDNELTRLRELTAELDGRTSAFTEIIVKAGKIPVMIGGGHNNSFGLLKGTSLALNEPVNCVNIDPHADLRMSEGRHSGNGFTYALQEKFLGKYFVAGLHENYNSSYILERFELNAFLQFITYESIRDDEIDYLGKIVNFIGTEQCGLEIDLDSIAGFPSSAATPSGFSIDEMRLMIRRISERLNISYVHFAEGAPEGISKDYWAKGLCYLVSDFLKTYRKKL